MRWPGDDRSFVAFVTCTYLASTARGSGSALSGGMAETVEVSLVEGRSPVVKVNERAATVVLTANGAELARAPLALRADGVNRVDL
jgi:hypothetical protein